MPLQKRLYVTGYKGFGESPNDPTNAIYTKEHMVYVSRVNLNVVEQDVKKNTGKPLVAPLTTLQVLSPYPQKGTTLTQPCLTEGAARE